jgi:hypothetical protein
MSLRDLLEKEKAAAEQSKADVEVRQDAWVKDLDKLNLMIKDALRPLVNDNLVSIEQVQSLRIESLTGSYRVTELKICAGRFVVSVKPVALHIFGANGRVDMFLEDRPDRVYLFTRRLPSALTSGFALERWLIVPPKEKGTGWDNSKAKPFSAETFERALQDLLERGSA